MRIVILGCGRVGSRLSNSLSAEGHTVVVIDKDVEAFRRLNERLSFKRLAGAAFSEKVMKQAFAEATDMFIAVADKDNINIMVAQIVKNLYHVPRILLRVQDPVLAELYNGLGMEAVCPTELSLSEFKKLVAAV